MSRGKLKKIIIGCVASILMLGFGFGFGGFGGFGLGGGLGLGPQIALADWTNGKFNSAMDFNGASDFIFAGDISENVKTVMFWIKADDITSRKILQLAASTDYYVEINGSSQIVAQNFAATPIYYIDGTATVTPTIDANWHFVAITDTTAIDASSVYLGRAFVGSTNYYFDGVLDDVKFFDRVLTAKEVAEHYRQDAPSMAQGGTISDSSTVGAALTIRQDSTGDILNLYDGGTEVFTVIDGGNVGIGTVTPTANLDVKGNLTTALTGTVAVDDTTAVVGTSTLFNSELRKGDSIKIVTETFTVSLITDDTHLTLDTASTSGTDSGLTAYKDSNLFYVQNGDSIGSVVVSKSGYLGVGDTSPGSHLTIGSSGTLAFGDINDAVIDDMESAEVAEWAESDTGNTDVATETTIVKMGAGSMVITTTVGSSNTTTLTKTFSSNQNFSVSDRIGFWTRATETGQIFSVKIHDTGPVTSTHAVTIDAANRWQYEEWDISGIAAASRDVVDTVQIYIDDDTGAPTIYIDQLRYYDKDNRSGEMFVDADGKLVLAGGQGIELLANIVSSLPALSIDAAIVEINQPFAVNVAGDTGINYDLQFLNTGVTYVTSAGPLVLAAGDPNHSENLTLTTQSNISGGDSGCASAGGASLLTDDPKSWTTNEWADGTVSIISGTGVGQVRTISSNTDDDITTSAAWTTPPAVNSYYTLAYARAGDILVNIAQTHLEIGGFKILGNDSSSYVFKVAPDGDVEIGGAGLGGSDLTVKQNITLTGGTITIGQLDANDAGTITTVEGAETGGACANANTYYYVIVALNDNGSTAYDGVSAGFTPDDGADVDDKIQVTWTAVSGATGYKLFRDTDSDFADGDNDWVDGKVISALDTTYLDGCDNDTANQTPATTNTTGGKLAINTTSPQARLDVLDTTSNAAQMRLTHDSDSYAEFYLDSGGDLSIILLTDTTSNSISFLDENVRICDGSTSLSSTSCPTTGYTISGEGNLIVEKKVVADTFERICDTNYVWVPGSAKYGTLPGFCVMKYEARCITGFGADNFATGDCDNYTSIPYVTDSAIGNQPWRYVSQEEARAKCSAIGADYHLISDAEWMTIAENIADTEINDIDEGTGDIQLSRGLSSADSPEEPADNLVGADPDISNCNLDEEMGDASNVWDVTAPGICEIRGDGGYAGDANDKGFYKTGDAWGGTTTYGTLNNGNNADDGDGQIRTHVLSNGEIIWDFAGNLWEWTDAYIIEDKTDGGTEPLLHDDDDGMTGEMVKAGSAAQQKQADWFEYTAVVDYQGLCIRPTDDAWDSTNGIGKIYTNPGEAWSGAAYDSSYHAFLRGGAWSNASNAGVFALRLGDSPASSANDSIGFRCSR